MLSTYIVAPALVITLAYVELAVVIAPAELFVEALAYPHLSRLWRNPPRRDDGGGGGGGDVTTTVATRWRRRPS